MADLSDMLIQTNPDTATPENHHASPPFLPDSLGRGGLDGLC